MFSNYSVKGFQKLCKESTEIDKDVQSLYNYLAAIEKVRHSQDEHEVVCLVSEHKLFHEHVPTWMKNSKSVCTVLVIHCDDFFQIHLHLSIISLIESWIEYQRQGFLKYEIMRF